MKTPVSPHTVVLLLLSSLIPLSAQNLSNAPRSTEVSTKADMLDDSSNARFTEVSTTPGDYDVPAVEKALGQLPDGPSVYASQDSLTLNTQATGSHKVESVVDLNVLRNPSPYRKVLVSMRSGAPNDVAAGSLQSGLALISAVYRETGKAEKSSDCSALALSVQQRIKLDPAKVLEVVESEVGANPSCACEIVKMAIKASEADVKLVVAIVQTAITTAPDTMRIVSQCAIAAMPESITEVQALLAKLDPNSGNEGDSSKSAKSAKIAEVASIASEPLPNPLNHPIFPPNSPPILPPPVTSVNPSSALR